MESWLNKLLIVLATGQSGMAKKTVDLVNPALQKIRTTRGLPGKIAKRLKLTRTAVWMWKRVPPHHAVQVARMLEMPVHKVCPEVFPPPQKPRTTRTAQPVPEA